MRCKNCNNFVNEQHNYCGYCGAKVIRNRLSPKILAEQLNQEILAIDNRFFRTFYALLRAPQDVIIGYINGVRRKYQDVLQYIAISLTILGFQVFLTSMFFSEFFAEQDALLRSIENSTGQADNPNPFTGFKSEDFSNYAGVIYILLVPFSALSTWLAYYILKDRRFNLTEHFVINLYYTAQLIIISSIISIIFIVFHLNHVTLSFLTSIITLVYFFYVLKKVFNDNFLIALAKFMVVMVFYAIFIILTLIILTIVMVYLMNLEV